MVMFKILDTGAAKAEVRTVQVLPEPDTIATFNDSLLSKRSFSNPATEQLRRKSAEIHSQRSFRSASSDCIDISAPHSLNRKSAVVLAAQSLPDVDADNATWTAPLICINANALLGSPTFQIITGIALGIALFGPDIATLSDTPDTSGVPVIDALMLICMVWFIFDIIIKVMAARRQYVLSVFFLFDLLGTFSCAFDISFLLGNLDRGNIFLTRSARASKVGSRVGRMLRVSGLLSFTMQSRTVSLDGKDFLEAKVLTQHLNLQISGFMAVLAMFLVIFIPLFSLGLYPREDLSMQAFAQALESDYANALNIAMWSGRNSTMQFSSSVNRLKTFYNKMDYFPYKLEGWCEQVIVTNTTSNWTVSIPGQSLIQNPDPAQRRNRVEVVTEERLTMRLPCGAAQAAIYFDFRKPNQIEAGMDILLIFFVIALLAGSSSALFFKIKVFLIRPLEHMLVDAAFIVDSYKMAVDGVCSTELDILVHVLDKFARLVRLSSQAQVISAQELSKLDDDSKAVVTDLLALEVEFQTGDQCVSTIVGAEASNISGIQTEQDDIDSWTLDVLKYDATGLTRVVLFIFFDSELSDITGKLWTEPQTFQVFLEAVRTSYHDLPYHCFAHACDTLHALYRLNRVCEGKQWLSCIEQYATLIAALGHDLGHFGRTNQFLVETEHELALTYNDKSPLENMHCSKLFQICKRPEANVFNIADKGTRHLARKVCVETILHTDISHHFDMVKEISQLYEQLSDLCEVQAFSSAVLNSDYKEEVLCRHKMLWLKLFLHLSDISNPLKPFEICQAWAMRVLEEFFAQGDEETRLGLPVGMMNDRSKISKSGSQHGFITFLVAPLLITSVKLFPNLHPLTSQMAYNLREWREAWVLEVNPSADDITKRDADVQKLSETAVQLRHRVHVDYRKQTMSLAMSAKLLTDQSVSSALRNL